VLICEICVFLIPLGLCPEVVYFKNEAINECMMQNKVISRAMATRDLQDLIEKSVLIPKGEGRNRNYDLNLE
jgi:hypothetical protein